MERSLLSIVSIWLNMKSSTDLSRVLLLAGWSCEQPAPEGEPMQTTTTLAIKHNIVK